MATRASERTVERDRQEQEKKSMYSRKRGMKWCVNESHSFFPGSGHETHMRVASVTWRCGFSTSRSHYQTFTILSAVLSILSALWCPRLARVSLAVPSNQPR